MRRKQSSIFILLIFLCLLLFIGQGFAKKVKSKLYLKRQLQNSNIEQRTLDLISVSAIWKFIALFIVPMFVLIPLFLLAGALLLIPIPVLTSPVAGIAAAIGRRNIEDEDSMELILNDVKNSSECIKRISCEIGRNVNNNSVRSILDQTLNELAPFLKEKWKGIIHGYIFGSNGRVLMTNNCGTYKCNIRNDGST